MMKDPGLMGAPVRRWESYGKEVQDRTGSRVRSGKPYTVHLWIARSQFPSCRRALRRHRDHAVEMREAYRRPSPCTGGGASARLQMSSTDLRIRTACG